MQTQATKAPTVKRRSVKLTTQEKQAFKRYINSFDYVTDAIEDVGLTRPTFYVIQARGSGFPENINKIKEALQRKGMLKAKA